MKILNDFLFYGFKDNRGLWAHIAGALLLSKIFGAWWFNDTYSQVIVDVFAVALVYEFFELMFQNKRIPLIYGSWKRYAYDTAGDIIAAVLVAVIV